MKIAITGATGLVGSALAPFLIENGHDLIRLSRSGGAGFSRWEPSSGQSDPGVFANCEAIVHLAGANLAAGRWTPERKREIVDSRVQSTRAVVDAMSRMPEHPRVLVCASGVGFYGDTGDMIADETFPKGLGFLADVCERWETEASRASDLGVRVVILRLGPVLSPKGGALGKMLPFFRLGLGGRIASGEQWMSWIAIDDAISAIAHVLANEMLSGPVNAISPEAVRSREFAATLGRVLRRPAILPVPAFMLRMALGQMAEETLLASSRATPRRLLETGFRFRHPTLEEALRHLCE